MGGLLAPEHPPLKRRRSALEDAPSCAGAGRTDGGLLWTDDQQLDRFAGRAAEGAAKAAADRAGSERPLVCGADQALVLLEGSQTDGAAPLAEPVGVFDRRRLPTAVCAGAELGAVALRAPLVHGDTV